MAHYKAILFDMDGTLLPMDTGDFTKGYFKFLYAKIAKHGLEMQTFVKSMWAGVEDMVRNDGSKTNEEAFWIVFEQLTGVPCSVVNGDCLEFYGNEFHQAKCFTGENPLAAQAVALAHRKAERVALATNPLFPEVGQKTRMSWLGLSYADFDLVTSYETDRFCKPNPQYFLSVCQRLGVEPKDCLMIGNDEFEDMYAASKTGMDCYLVTDCAIPSEEHPWQGRKGSFAQLVEFLNELD